MLAALVWYIMYVIYEWISPVNTVKKVCDNVLAAESEISGGIAY